MNRPPLKGIRHLALKVQNMNAMRHFYVDILGFEIEWEPDPENLYLTSGSDNLALHQVSQDVPKGALDHLGILVERPEQVDQWAEYLTSNGVKIKAPPRTHRDGARSTYFPDPEDNLIQLIYHPPISGK
jgi:catechol 2,3-dioxygenase-like lactoylglutathione lyase family enzyme